ncbi:putative NmrA family transcriptional regulator [Macrophomina phaseolina]|uniref:NmrA family transcriptional regulator n=1 Tax=Macrophomina phaseolina TaxID=35725 RepID=A0ABQ8G8Q8_9PEZI|nr:putative NmrA family transcriptional regulator [Macrophomina phaseolina]
MSKLITVFGATGNQGGSVIETILADAVLSKEFKIRGITRDASKPAAQDLKSKGVEIVTADMSDPTTLATALKGSHTVFLVTKPAYGAGPPDAELIYAKSVADACKNAGGIQHLIFSSLPHVTNESGGRLTHVPHWDHKAEAEAYMRSAGLPATFVLPAYFMTNYTAVGFLKKGSDGVYTLRYPVGADARIPLLDCNADLGRYVCACIKRRDRVLGARVLAAADYYTPARIVAEFEEVTGRPARYLQVDPQTYKDTFPIPGVPDWMLTEMLETHQFLEESGYFSGADLKKNGLDLLAEAGYRSTSWKEFLTRQKDSIA